MTLFVAAETSGAINAFIDNGVLRRTLEQMGDVEFKAAILALNQAEMAKNTYAQITLAVGHLQSAHVAFSEVSQGRTALQLAVNLHAWEQTQFKNTYTLCLMAICFRYLGEDLLVLDTIDRAEKHYKDSFPYSSRGVKNFATTVGVMSPLTWLNKISDVVTKKSVKSPHVGQDALYAMEFFFERMRSHSS